MLPLLKQLCAWGCWWEVNQGCPISEAFVTSPLSSGWQYCRQYASHHASPKCSTTAVRHSIGDAAQRCRWGATSSSSTTTISSRSHSKSRTGRRERGSLGGGGGGVSSSFRRTGRRHRNSYPGLCAAVTTTTTAVRVPTSSAVGTTHATHGLEDGGVACSSAAGGNRRLASARRQRQEQLRAAPRRVDASPGRPAAIAGTYVDAPMSPAAGMPPMAKTVSKREEDSTDTVGSWLRFTNREMALLQRKAPSVRKDERRREVLARSLDGKPGQDCSVIAVLRGARLGMTPEECKKVVLKHPCLLTMSGEGPSERLAWMITNLAVSQDQLRAIVLKQPRLLSNNIEVNMAPAVLFLTEELGLSIEMVAAIIRKFPEVLNLSVERKLAVKIRWFEETLGMERPEIARMVFTLPALFGYSIEDNMEPKIAWLQEAFGTSRQTALQMMVKWPGLFTCNVERNLKPTLEYFLDDLSGNEEEVRDIVTSNPRLLGASIEKRLRPRVARMLNRGVVATFSEHRWVLAIRTDAFFDQWVEGLETREEAGISLSSTAAAAIE